MHICPRKGVSEAGVCSSERAEEILAAFSLVASLDEGRYFLYHEKGKVSSGIQTFRSSMLLLMAIMA